MTDKTDKLPSTFWIISAVALLWNIMGVIAYLGQAYMTEKVLKALPIEEQEYYHNLPVWVTAVFATAVFAGVIGSIALLMRKKWSTIFFIISLIAVISQFIYNVFIQKDVELSGTKIIWPIVVLLIALLLVYFSRKAAKEGWIS